MTSYILGGLAAVGVAWGYLSKLTFLSGAKYYVSQQLAQMQMHFFNKDHILRAAKASKDKRLPALVKQIFEDYKKDIHFDDWCWIKNSDGKWQCVKQKDKQICPGEKFGGIFPPIATLENTVKVCNNFKEQKSWLNTWSNVVKGYGTGYLSNLEYYVLQLEALEQDMAIMPLKF
jgi:hypothetical protein